MNKSQSFVLFCVAFCAGILLGSKFNIPQPHLYLAAAVFVILIPVFEQGSRKRLASIFLVMVCLGVLRIQVSHQLNQFEPLFGTNQSLEGVIAKDVDVRENFQMFTIKPEEFKQNVLVTVTKTGKFFYGDKVWITGKLTEPQDFNNFDYSGYLERQNVYGLMKYPKVIVLNQHQGNWFVEKLLRVKYLYINQINKVLEEPYASLLLGILIGARKALPSEIVDNFNATGTSHIIAISGYNISIIVSSLGFLSYYFGRKSSFVITIIIIFIFTIISGASASVIRASVMGGLLLASSRVGRLYAITPALCFAAVCMLIANPKILYWDASFQLSFLATAGIVYGLPILQELTKSWPKLLGLKLIFLTTMSAIIATLPLILLLFGRLSLVAPLVNILILPVVPATMFFGFFSVVPFFGAGFAFMAHLLMWYMLSVIGFFAHLKFAAIGFQLALWQFYVMWGIILAAYFTLKRYVEKHKPL